MIVENEIEINKSTIDDAKKFAIDGNHELACAIYEHLWEVSGKDDPYLLFDYGKVLRKIGKANTFIKICLDEYSKNQLITNKFIVSQLCWCLYDFSIKNYSLDDADHFQRFLKNAKYIIDNCEQKSSEEAHYNPYVLTIRKVVKIYNARASINFHEIIEWLSHLNPDLLSDKDFPYKDEEGKSREIASPKEFYYQNMIKSLEKTNQLNDCISMCELALEKIKKFHYRNDIWIKSRLYFCKCLIQDDNVQAIIEFKKLADKENSWFMYHKLSQIYFRKNMINESLLSACKALRSRFEHEKMVNLLFDIALLWQAVGENGKAKLFFHACGYYRNKQEWFLSEELKYAIDVNEININERPNISELLNISEKYIVGIEGSNQHKGSIVNMISHMKSGFIKPSAGGSNIYFNVREIDNRALLKIGAIVEYSLSSDNQNRPIATKIFIRG